MYTTVIISRDGIPILTGIILSCSNTPDDNNSSCNVMSIDLTNVIIDEHFEPDMISRYYSWCAKELKTRMSVIDDEKESLQKRLDEVIKRMEKINETV